MEQVKKENLIKEAVSLSNELREIIDGDLKEVLNKIYKVETSIKKIQDKNNWDFCIKSDEVLNSTDFIILNGVIKNLFDTLKLAQNIGINSLDTFREKLSTDLNCVTSTK